MTTARSQKTMLLLCIPAAALGAVGALTPLASTVVAVVAVAVLCLHPASPIPALAERALDAGK